MNEVSVQQIPENIFGKFTAIEKYGNADSGLCGFRAVNGLIPPLETSPQNLQFPYIYREDSVVIPFLYDDALEFSEGFAAVKKHGKWGTIALDGSQSIPFKFDKIGEDQYASFYGTFREGLATAQENGLWGYINVNGNWAIPPAFEEAKAFREGRAWVKVQGKHLWSIIDRDGHLLQQTDFEVVQPFIEGKALVLPHDGGWSVIDMSGNFLVRNIDIPGFGPPSMAFSYSEGIAVVGTQNGFYGYMDAEGECVIAPIYDGALGFSFGLAGASIYGKWGFIAHDGKWSISPKYDYVASFIQLADGSVKSYAMEGERQLYLHLNGEEEDI